MSKKKQVGLKPQKITRQQAKLLMRSGGELDDMMLGSVVEKMRKGGKAKRVVKNNDGSEKMQEYKMGELNDPVEQRARFEDEQSAKEAGDLERGTVDEDYLRALEYGMPPTGGLGIGMDRVAMLIAGVDSIREVVLFPTLRPEVMTDES